MTIFGTILCVGIAALVGYLFGFYSSGGRDVE